MSNLLGFPTIIPTDISNVSKEEAALYYAYHDLIVFGKLFDPGNFRKSKTPDFHHEICHRLNEQSTKPIALILPRSSAKTTLIKNKVLHDLVYAVAAYEWGFVDKASTHFMGWVSDNQKKSQNNIAYVKHHISRNRLLRRYFGDLRVNGKWNQEDITLTNGSRLLSRSNLTSLRGEVQTSAEEGEMRYTHVFADDVENEANTLTDGARDKIRSVVMNGIYPAIDKHKGRLYWMATPIHGDAFTQRIMDGYAAAKENGELDKYTWDLVSYPSTQPEREGGVLWHSYMPREKLDEAKQTYIDSPRGVQGYYQEYELQVQSSEDSVWSHDHLRYFKGYYKYEDGQGYLVMDNREIPVNVFIGIDPATDIESRTSDYSVLMVIAVDSEFNCYVLEYVMKRSIPALGLKDSNGDIFAGQKKGVVDYLVELVKKYNPQSITCEDVGMNRAVFQGWSSEQMRLGMHKYGMVPEKPQGRNKLNRIYATLNTAFTSKRIYIQDGMYDLRHQIVMFGDRLAHDDVIDAFSYAYCNAYPPNFEINEEREYVPRRKRKAKGWTYA